jgi:uncharacterized caspase-like protein
VVDGIDLDKTAFDRKVRDFATALLGAEVGVFFYAGHGMQVGGQTISCRPMPANTSTEDDSPLVKGCRIDDATLSQVGSGDHARSMAIAINPRH